MTIIDCPNCHKIFTHINSLNYHLSHKVCVKTTDKTCGCCGLSFTSKRRCQYHISHNVCMKKPKIKLTLKNNDNYDAMSKDQLISELTYVKGKYDSLRENPTTNNNMIIFPTAFGTENINMISQKLGDILGPLLKGQTFTCIPKLFAQIHNNQQLPEYHNVYSISERSSYAMVSDGKSFKYRPKKTIIDQIIEDKRSLLNNYIDANGGQLGERVLKKYENYQDQIDSDSEFRKSLELEIGGMLLDMKSVIANDDKTRKLLDKVCEGNFDLD